MAVWKQCLPPTGPDLPRALFLDRDGVVIADRDYLADPDQVELLPGAAATIQAARAQGFLVIGVSNQSGIGRGLFTAEDLGRVMRRLDDLLAAAGTCFDGFYYCPHAPGEHCRCRKPAPGLFEEAEESCRWDPARSWVIGDKVSDMAFARRRGLGAVLVRTGYGAEQEPEVLRRWKNDSRVMIEDNLPAAFAALSLLEPDEPSR